MPNEISTQESSKTCFVIAPIGEGGSAIRVRSDQILNYIISPVASECGYSVTRADGIADPGMIDRQILQHIVYSDLVVADLTGNNPNVFYELAVRHMLAKPTITIIADGEPLPFDVIQNRTIKVDHTDLDRVEEAKRQLRDAIQASEKNPDAQDNPVSFAVQIATLSSSNNPVDQSAAKMMEMHSDLLSGFNHLEQILQVERPDDEELLLQSHIHTLDIGALASEASETLEALALSGSGVEQEVLSIYGAVQQIVLNAQSLRSLLRKRLSPDLRSSSRLKPLREQHRRVIVSRMGEDDE